MATATARSSCGSWPACMVLGSSSTSTSGATPLFSTSHWPSGLKKPKLGGGGDVPATLGGRVGADPHQAAPGAFANQCADFVVVEHPGHAIATRASEFINDHHLRSEDGGRRRAIDGAVARAPEAFERAAEHVDHVIGHLTAAVEALIDDGALFIGLREVIARETGKTALAGIGPISGGQFSAPEVLRS